MVSEAILEDVEVVGPDVEASAGGGDPAELTEKSVGIEEEDQEVDRCFLGGNDLLLGALLDCLLEAGTDSEKLINLNS